MDDDDRYAPIHRGGARDQETGQQVHCAADCQSLVQLRGQRHGRRARHSVFSTARSAGSIWHRQCGELASTIPIDPQWRGLRDVSCAVGRCNERALRCRTLSRQFVEEDRQAKWRGLSVPTVSPCLAGASRPIREDTEEAGSRSRDRCNRSTCRGSFAGRA